MYISVHTVVGNKSPQYLRQLVHTGGSSERSSRNSILIFLPKQELTFVGRVLLILDPFALPRSLEITCSVSTFKSTALLHFRTECNTGFQS